MRLKAFTLAEVMITLSIIGIVAVIAIFSILNQVFDDVRAKHTIASKHKFAKALERMALNYDIGPYYGTGEDKKDATAEFVNKLSEYYKINKICSNASLSSCWGYSLIKFANGNTYDIDDAVNGKLFKNGGNESLSDDYDVDTMGILGVDGTRFILAYNKNCEFIEPQIYIWTKDGTNNSATGCVAAIMDIDGNKTPNTVGKDISFFNATSIGKNCIVEIGDACFGSLFLPAPVSAEECEANREKWGLSYCAYSKTKGATEDYYAGAVKICGSKSNMVSAGDFRKWAQTAYKEDGSGNTQYIKGSAEAAGLIEPDDSGYVLIWLNTEHQDAYNFDTHGNYFIYGKSYVSFTQSATRSGDHAAKTYGLCKIVE